jgi:hypothetical protein
VLQSQSHKGKISLSSSAQANPYKPTDLMKRKTKMVYDDDQETCHFMGTMMATSAKNFDIKLKKQLD